MGMLGPKLSRFISLCVVSGCMLSGVYGDETIDSTTTEAKEINISSNNTLTFTGAGCLNIGSNTSSSLKAISFGTSETDTGAGKAFTINNNSSAEQLINVDNTYSNSSGYCTASAIDLTGISGVTGKTFTISFPTTGKTYSFSSTAGSTNSDANSFPAGTYAAVIGLPSASSNSVEYIAVNTKNTAKLNFNATATGGTTYSGAAVFGTGHANSISSVQFSNWAIDAVASGSKLTATASGTKDRCSTIYGAGRANGNVNFSGWKIGTIEGATGNDRATTLTSTAEKGYSSVFGVGYAYLNSNSKMINFSGWKIGSFESNSEKNSIGNNVTITSNGQYATIFGAGYVDGYVNFQNWTIGNVGDNVTFTSNANNETTDATSAYSSVLGVGYAKGNNVQVKNWTMEFQGNSVIASTASGSSNNISTFGGCANGGDNVSDGMRFYFNGEQATGDPVVTIGALKLSVPWAVADGTATATIGKDQGGARAFEIGRNFQINVGRKRTLKVDGSGETDGTGETFDSIKNGGSSSSGIKLNILGEIKASNISYDYAQDYSVMRIDGGSTVNCFRPVSNLSKIEIINGSMHLMDSSNKAELDDALQHLQANISYSKYNATTKKTELYQNNGAKTAIGSAGAKRVGRDGNVKLANSGYPIDGKLTIGSGQALVFGVDLNEREEFLFEEKKDNTTHKTNYVFKKSDGVLYVPSVGGHLALSENCVLDICDGETGGGLTDEDGNSLTKLPENTSFWVVRSDYNKDLIVDTDGNVSDNSFLKLDSNGFKVSNTSASTDVQLYQIKKTDGTSIVSTGVNGSQYLENVHAYLMNDEHLGGGIVIGDGNLLITDWIEEYPDNPVGPDITAPGNDDTNIPQFVNAELSAIDAEIMSDIQKQVIFAEMCAYKQDPFIMVLGGHGHQDEILGYGYDYDKYGVVIGHDFVKELSNGGNWKYGVMVGFCHANIDFFGNATSTNKRAKKDIYNCGVFGMYKNENAKHLHTRFHVFGGFAYVENEMSRVDSNNAHFNAKFDSNDINVSAEFTRGMVKLCGLEVGPWAGVTYNRIHQKSYHENGGTNAASLDSVNFDMLDTILGLHAEKIFLHKKNDKRYLHLVLRAGWKCQAIRSHSHCLAQLDNAGVDPFVPVFGYADKHSGIVYGGLKNKISDNLSISGGIGSVIGHDHWNIGGHIALNYYY